MRNPAAKALMRIRTSAKLVRNEPSMRQQMARGGAIAGTMLFAVQQDEEQPRREVIRSKTGHSETRRNAINDGSMKRAFDDEMFRRYCGLVGRGPRLPSGTRSRSGVVSPWNWRRFDE
eukprot:11798491-Alexandrium_andersonii.AAC.1